MQKPHVSLVKQHNFSLRQTGTDLDGPSIIVLVCRLDERALRQETLQVEPDVQLGGGFAAPVLGPGHATGNQLDNRRIYRMNRASKPPQQFAFPGSVKLR